LSDPEINDVVWASPDELTEPHQTNALDSGIPSGLNTLRQRRGGVPFVRPQMRNIAFLVVIAVFSCGCAGLLYSPLPGENPTASTEVGLSVMTAEAPNREIEYRTYRDFLLYVNGPDVQEALAIVDTVLRRRGYELHKAQERDAVPIDNWYRHPNSGSGSVKCWFIYRQRKQDKSGSLAIIVSRSSLLYLGPGQEVMQTRDEIFGELVKRFGKDRVTRGTRFDHYGRSSDMIQRSLKSENEQLTVRPERSARC